MRTPNAPSSMHELASNSFRTSGIRSVLLLSLAASLPLTLACGGQATVSTLETGGSTAPSSGPVAEGPEEESGAVSSGAAEGAQDSEALAPRPPPPATLPEPSLGPDDAPVVVEIYSDYECPHCALARGHVSRLRADFPEDVRIVHRNFPLQMHSHAQEAAEAAMDALEQGGVDAFWRYHELLFDHQRNLSRRVLLRLGREAGLNVAYLQEALETGRHRERVNADRAAADALGLRGTPTFVVNGQPLVSADYLDIEEAVDLAR